MLRHDVFRTGTSRQVWFVLMRDAGQDGTLKISARAIAKEIGVDEKTIRNCLKSFCDNGIIQIDSPQVSPHLYPQVSPQKVRYAGQVVKLNNTICYMSAGNCQVRKKSALVSAPMSDIKPDIPKVGADQFKNGFERFREWFNAAVGGTDIPRLIKFTDARKNALRAIFKEYGKETVETVVQKVIASDFLAKEWGKVSFDWIFKKSNFIKILEGNYDNRTTNNQAADKYSARRGTDVGDISEVDYTTSF